MEPSSQLDNGSTSHYLARPQSPGSDNSHQRRPLIGPPPGAGPVVMLAAHPLPPGGAQPIPPAGGLQYETYIKSQLLSNLYLQQYMTNNLANIGHLGVVGGADHLLSFTAAAAAQSAVLPPVPSVTLTAVQSRSKPRRLAAAVVTESCGPGPLDLSSSRPEVPAAVATAAAATSQPVVITKISLAPAPPPAHVRVGENGSVPTSAETGLNLSSALLVKAAASPAEPAGDVLTKAENEEGEREDDSPPSPPSATEASAASEEPPAASANPNACPICGQSFTGQDRYAG
jgi:hypothetical protein